MFLGRREDVEDPAAHGELPAPFDEIDSAVRRGRKPVDDLVQTDLVAGSGRDRLEIAEAGYERLKYRPDRRDDDADRSVTTRVLGMGQPSKYRQPEPDGVRTGRQAFVRQRFPGREHG